MTLGQFAVAVGASPRWVLNALTRLRVPRRYDEPLARRLALAKTLHASAGFTLPSAWEAAGRILREADYFKDWQYESDDGLVTVRVGLPRFFTNYQVRLAVAHSSHAAPKRRGRAPSRRGSAAQRAWAYGIDVTLLDANLAETTDVRLRRLDSNRRVFERPREANREHRSDSPGPE
ncbi:MAG: hypothetical protein A2083_07920 [Gemmatimonadetes bacterium GWC2_71_9]|nr:MAG: hypothetical protein A3I79_03555 [Gemmatimonadetes bacterium RIFCSPLOWO2_02_FULL_71_11]OGT95525.1 MAG: hypothetical protein A2083_07920 [Gemmatimonadetes bacterium GWC2_71_9]